MNSLPVELIQHVFVYIDIQYLYIVKSVCKYFYSIINDDNYWKNRFIQDFGVVSKSNIIQDWQDMYNYRKYFANYIPIEEYMNISIRAMLQGHMDRDLFVDICKKINDENDIKSWFTIYKLYWINLQYINNNLEQNLENIIVLTYPQHIIHILNKYLNTCKSIQYNSKRCGLIKLLFKFIDKHNYLLKNKNFFNVCVKKLIEFNNISEYSYKNIYDTYYDKWSKIYGKS